MRAIAGFLAVMVLLAVPPSASWAGDADTIEAINQAAAKLDRAFEQQDAATIKQLMTPDHVAVTPYYDGPQSVDEQIASLPDLKYAQTNLTEPSVTLLGPDAALRRFTAKLEGGYKEKVLAGPVYITQVMVMRDGKWLEDFYQVTALKP
jgi:ketosteroid isomerase-like protein